MKRGRDHRGSGEWGWVKLYWDLVNSCIKTAYDEKESKIEDLTSLPSQL